jgi:transposase-like protein
MPRLKGSADLLEDRRRRALALLDDGYSLNEVGRRIGCQASSVMRWRDARRHAGRMSVSYSDHYQEKGAFQQLMDRLRKVARGPDRFAPAIPRR